MQARLVLISHRPGHGTSPGTARRPRWMQTQYSDMTAQGQAIWVNGPARPKGPRMG